MRVVVQKVTEAAVLVGGEIIGEIGKGFMLLVGIGKEDAQEDVCYIARKVANLRDFEDEEGKMNRSLKDVGGDILSISQFTLFADTKKGNRPSFINAAAPETSEALYQEFNERLRAEGFSVASGKFGAHMAVSLVNDGPVTIIIDSKNK
ncbi:MAG TPA: D-aminoacyl-tRNA deacylase [Trichococcus flocculiformis]|nr:D-aminoacyl-tRNA deacylase [Trichococcus flocculiformis]